MSGMSRPRDATSVAISIFVRPARKAASARSRSNCGLSPWIARECRGKSRCRSSHWRFVAQNTITRPGCCCMSSCRRQPLSRGSTHQICCVMESVVPPTLPMTRKMSSSRNSLANVTTCTGRGGHGTDTRAGQACAFGGAATTF